MSSLIPPGSDRTVTPVDSPGEELTRRQALKLLATQIAVGLASCGKPDEEIIPYVRMPERLVPGEPLRFATSLPLGGYARGILGISIDGRPIKVEGNPLHPASLGATDAFAEAAIFSLYDPGRSRTVLQDGSIASWDMFLKALLPRLERFRTINGQGLSLLTGRITSPTLARQLGLILKSYPQARWHSYEPVGDDAERAGVKLAFGRALRALSHLDRADVMVTLDADPLGPGPDQIRNARGWFEGRKTIEGQRAISRLYAIEAAPTLTGVKADHRLALHPGHIHDIAITIANALGASLPAPDLPPHASRFVQAAVQDLTAHRGRALVLAGRTLSSEAHALVHWINARVAAPVEFIEEPESAIGQQPGSLSSLAADLEANRVEMLVLLDVNPAYDAPAELRLRQLLARVPFSVHHGSYVDETASLCRWHVAASHPLESWSDLCSIDGTASIVQPLIRPLYATRTEHELLASLVGKTDAASYDLVRETWAARGIDDFDQWWRKVLHDGVIAGSKSQSATTPEPRMPAIAPSSPLEGMALVLQPDDCVWDGRFANNAWLQECPKPITKQVWGNALGLGPTDAESLGVATGDIVRLDVQGRSILVPVNVVAGHAPKIASLTLGYGRTRAGAIGSAIGANAFALRSPDTPWLIQGVGIVKTEQRGEILTTQNYVRIPGRVDDLYPVITVASLVDGGAVKGNASPLPSLYPNWPADRYAWGMVIDAAACIGCNACVMACQAENNVPVVGPQEIARGRDMHWLRIDIYDHGTLDQPKPGFQPVPCMHCEQAPCEPVCPVAASVHDREGLNVQVYNRCIGTRFCEANCPYKVRRFNFFAYADGQEYGDLGGEAVKAQRNPDVSVRTRGVMEKCTYCVQRISRSRRAAEKDDRAIADGEVITACQSACPTQAITFGNLNDQQSAVRRLKTGPRHYALLGDLGTRPRTTYLADFKNPNPIIEDDAS